MSPSPRSSSGAGDKKDPPIRITPRLLRDWSLPQPDAAADKEARGRVLIVGGAAEMPGAVVLAGLAALRAGAGKLRMAVPASIAPWVGTAVPEGRVFALPETESGEIAAAAAETLIRRANEVQCVLLGPGMADERAAARLAKAVLPALHGPTVVLDALALLVLAQEPGLLRTLQGAAIITPHAGEMASCLGIEKREVSEDPAATARRAADQSHCVTALKGAETVIAAPDGSCYRNHAGNVGLATSGSGDTLAGVVAGLAARGAEPLQAAVWGVHLHARAGDRLAQKIGPLGFLARELLAEIPALMRTLAGPR